MNQEESLKIYIQRLEKIAQEQMRQRNISAIEALKEALNFIEGEMLER